MAWNARNRLPEPKWTHVGRASVSACISFQSKPGSFTPAASHAARSFRLS